MRISGASSGIVGRPDRDHLRKHPEFAWEKDILRDLDSYPWTKFQTARNVICASSPVHALARKTYEKRTRSEARTSRSVLASVTPVAGSEDALEYRMLYDAF